MVTYNEGRLGTVVCDNGFRYDLQWEDLLWYGRMLSGEAPPGTGRQEYAALLWCYTQRWANLRRGSGNGAVITVQGEPVHTNCPSKFSAYLRLHSQPINPRWQRDGYFCRPGGPNHGTDRCAPNILDRRDQKAQLPWNSISGDRQQALIDWARGRLPNPIPGHVDFAAGPSPGRPQGWRPNRDVINGPAPLYGGTRVTPRGNVFYKQVGGPSSRRTINWPDNYVRIEFNDEISSVDTSNNSDSGPTSETHSVTRETRSSEENVFVREERITSNRSEPPSSERTYSTLSGSTRDPQAASVFSQHDEELRIFTSQERFYNQMISFKDVSTLDMAQAVPVIQIETQNENGDIVNLNDLIFGTSPFSEIFRDDNDGFDDLQERPIASIVGLTLKVETPSVGGPTGILVGTLNLKVHNPEKVTSRHPRGKYISWMMRMGFYMRIRYGVYGPENSRGRDESILHNAFQWREQDFFVAQHDLNINDDKTYDLNLTIMPAAHKLLNQIHIGESIPFSAGETQLSQDDINNVLNNITSDVSDQNQINEMRRRLERFQSEFNSGHPSAGYRIQQVEGENGSVTIGSVLHGAISQSRILDQTEGRQQVPIENMVDGLRSIQSILLTRRFERVLSEESFNTVLKGVQAVAVKVGPLIERIVLPEFQQIVLYTSQNNLKIGESFSSDNEQARNSETRRTKVLLVFGTFNSKAGQWANRPISEFPINANSIFSYLRQNRSVGQFSSTANGFIGRIAQMANEPANYVLERTQQKEGERPRPVYRIERPQIKYLFYPDPANLDTWILYVYDNKREMVQFSELLGVLNKETTISKQEIIDRLREQKIPWIEMGEEGSIIKQMTARTQADDRLMAHNMLLANQNAITVRDVDGSERIPAGMDSEFMNGAQIDPQNVIRATTLILPIEVTMTSYMLATANLFQPIYVFMPTKMFEGLYMPYVVENEIRGEMAQTRMTLQVNLTQANRVSE